MLVLVLGVLGAVLERGFISPLYSTVELQYNKIGSDLGGTGGGIEHGFNSPLYSTQLNYNIIM